MGRMLTAVILPLSLSSPTVVSMSVPSKVCFSLRCQWNPMPMTTSLSVNVASAAVGVNVAVVPHSLPSMYMRPSLISALCSSCCAMLALVVYSPLSEKLMFSAATIPTVMLLSIFPDSVHLSSVVFVSEALSLVVLLLSSGECYFHLGKSFAVDKQ